MNIDLTNKNLQSDERKEIEILLSMQNPQISDDLEQMWYLIDLVWDNMGCDNSNLDWEKIVEF